MASPPWVWGPRIEYGAGSGGRSAQGEVPAFAGTTGGGSGDERVGPAPLDTGFRRYDDKGLGERGGHAVTAVASGEAKETRGSSQA